MLLSQQLTCLWPLSSRNVWKWILKMRAYDSQSPSFSLSYFCFISFCFVLYPIIVIFYFLNTIFNTALCGNGYCNETDGENCISCPVDCKEPSCGISFFLSFPLLHFAFSHPSSFNLFKALLILFNFVFFHQECVGI